jgi:hypothetical protein
LVRSLSLINVFSIKRCRYVSGEVVKMRSKFGKSGLLVVAFLLGCFFVFSNGFNGVEAKPSLSVGFYKKWVRFWQ